MYKRTNISYVSPKKRTGIYWTNNKSFERVANFEIWRVKA